MAASSRYGVCSTLVMIFNVMISLFPVRVVKNKYIYIYTVVAKNHVQVDLVQLPTAIFPGPFLSRARRKLAKQASKLQTRVFTVVKLRQRDNRKKTGGVAYSTQ